MKIEKQFVGIMLQPAIVIEIRQRQKSKRICLGLNQMVA